ncbi:MATE family efflux transporter [Runella sp. MFBS21]|uniref:MATE family efflux transporter n=1 Tax=Runella sp. MFBS21 TaxID=3034018 RepID=UPI0023F938DD|nr:MATE family efflux transporter [Runella sp. MFBS21]MDF7820558.1 MATE family efflux transporter [Runella sp. MFBS21]
MKKFFQLLLQALKGEEQEYTTGSINRAIFLLSVPMILEMVMESLFAVVDIFFVSQINTNAVATVGLTESVLTLVYSIAIGLSTAATAIVSRRIGEKQLAEAGHAAAQVILVSVILGVVVGVSGFLGAENILRAMGGSEELIASGSNFTRIIFASSPAIILLYTLSGVLRGGGDAAVAMRSLWIANGLNIALCPLFIFGWGPIPAFGVAGSAIATTIGRSAGVLYQLSALASSKGAVQVLRSQLRPDFAIIRNLISVAAGGTGQFIIASASWVFLTRILSDFGPSIVAGYTIAIRIIVFTILPSWGMANAAATLVGQNLGANEPSRAETSVWRAAFFNFLFLVAVAIIFFVFAKPIISWFNHDPIAVATGVNCLRIVCLGYLFFAYGMVISQSFNGAGDTLTPTLMNLVCFWAIEIPLAYLLAKKLALGPEGVYISVAFSESLLAIIGVILFRRGKWKMKKV